MARVCQVYVKWPDWGGIACGFTKFIKKFKKKMRQLKWFLKFAHNENLWFLFPALKTFEKQHVNLIDFYSDAFTTCIEDAFVICIDDNQLFGFRKSISFNKVFFFFYTHNCCTLNH